MKKCKTTVGQLNGSHELRAAVLGTPDMGVPMCTPTIGLMPSGSAVGTLPPSLPPSLPSLLTKAGKVGSVGWGEDG